MLLAHHVPMCRQRIEPDEWERHGGAALGDRAEWSDRACGMAALRMILLAYGQEPPTLTELIQLGVEKGALTERGWLHAGIASLAEVYGVPGQTEAVPAEELTARLKAAPVIISVTEKFPEDGRKGGHLVVALGFEPGEDPTILFRDPSGWGQTHDRVPLSRLSASYSGRAITFPAVTRTIAVLGEMLELGEMAAEEHQAVGRLVGEEGIDQLIVVGNSPNVVQLTAGALAGGVPEVARVADNHTAAAYLETIVRPGDKVLLKASRGGELWQIAQELFGQPITGH
ncbi:glutamate ligase domain-containing protein [Kitasatospora sp. NPDC087315]|uniref:glutamate ligase domain-containing protein n=1 Tax=Kitasatospora sp. NPDC087315 TaxID=3364069 RepID=UPI0037F124FA